ncbi:MAG: class I SAM-dependent methyltransferase [Chloroflexota bacterium]|nr:class I SAM-dependent methyltransferase [Chloroflexota bacterium]
MSGTDGASDPYAGIAELYDLEHGSYDDDLDLYRELARGTDRPVLELACGSGRVLVPIAAAGHDITGIDSSPPMLARATTAVAAAGVADRVKLLAGSMVEADQIAGGPFGLIIIALNSLLHVSTAAGQRQSLASARRLLGPGGRVVIDLLNPHPAFLRDMERGVQHEGTWSRPDGSRVDKFASRQVCPADQQIETELWYDLIAVDGGLSRDVASYPMRYVHRSELELLLELTGFSSWRVYGSYELDHFHDESDRLLIIAT